MAQVIEVTVAPDGATKIETRGKTRPGVVDERVFARAHDKRQALAHVEHVRLELAVGKISSVHILT